MERSEGMAQLVDEDRDEDDTDPGKYQIDAVQREAKERRNQQEGRPDLNRDVQKFKSQQDTMMPQLEIEVYPGKESGTVL